MTMYCVVVPVVCLTKQQRTGDLPFVHAVKKMAIVQEETRAAEPLSNQLEECQVKAEYLHVGDASTSVPLDRDVELGAIFGCFNNKPADAIAV